LILLIDNYDSFVFNLQRYLVRLGQSVHVERNDSTQLANFLAADCLPDTPDAIVISPGPRAPQNAGLCLDIVRRYSGIVPILGVCLGHQVIYEAFGGHIIRARKPVHGQSCRIALEACPIFDGLDQYAHFARYHSLVADPGYLPESLRVVAWSEDEQIMAVAHEQHATYGIQFHPESVLSLAGYRVLNNFLTIAGLSVCEELPACDLTDQVRLIDLQNPSKTIAPDEAEHAVILPSAAHSIGETPC
jgi:anthranilate synthase/aminodeoxychorismate synthase-like glutamine amidotransferase